MLTQGPRINTGLLRDGKAQKITAGQTLEFMTDMAMEGDDQRITCSYK
jgi:hypothetical protein